MNIKPNVLNTTLSTANTEVEQQLTSGVRSFSVQCRTSAVIRIAFVTGKVATPTSPFATIKAGTVYTIEDVYGKTDQISLFLASPTADVVAEIIEWT